MRLQSDRLAEREERNKRYIDAVVAAGRQIMARQAMQQQQQRQAQGQEQERTELRSQRRGR